MTPPTALFVHGAWHCPAHYQRALDVFNAKGYPAVCPKLPSYGGKAPISMVDDARTIQGELERLVEKEKKDVIVLAHSYGGIVITQAALKTFAKAERRASSAQGEGGIIRIIYLTAFLPLPDASLASTLGGLPPFVPVNEQDDTVTMQEPEHRFYNDLPDDEQKEWASLLKPMPRDALIAPVTHMGYLHHPVTYIHCEIDEAVPKGLQQMMVEGVKAATNISIETKSMPTGHSPFLSNPELLLELYQEYADATVQ